MPRRCWLFASLSLIAGFGCHAGPQPKVVPAEPPVTITDVTATRFIAQHNKRAAAIRSLEAQPSVALVGENSQRPSRRRANGHLALQRDKDFTLDLEVVTHNVANIGSNDKGFWFWVDDDPANTVYFCDHKDVGTTQLGATLQPDWIIEAMGLRQFTDKEARTIASKAGTQLGTLVLTQARKDPRGNVYTKETVVQESTGMILEHRLYAGTNLEPSQLLASAVITKYLEREVTNTGKVAVPSADDLDPRASSTMVYIPEKFRLNWIKEKFALDIEIPSKSLKLNPAFTDERQVALFSEPKIPGTSRTDLAQLDTATVPASARVYESRPIPHSPINLGPPQAMPNGSEKKSRRAVEPAPSAADPNTRSDQSAGVVGAVIPSGSDYSSDRSGSTALRFPTLDR